MKTISKYSKWISLLMVFSMFLSLFPAVIATAKEPKDDGLIGTEFQTLETSYSDLWTGTDIKVKVGVPVKWYVNVPQGTDLKDCDATIKIPGLGWGTDTFNDGEGHITLVEGKNKVYEFIPEQTGDILFTCWMGSGCHYNYIHVIENPASDDSDDSEADTENATEPQDIPKNQSQEDSKEEPQDIPKNESQEDSKEEPQDIPKKESQEDSKEEPQDIPKKESQEGSEEESLENPENESGNAVKTVTTEGEELWAKPIDIHAQVGDIVTWIVTLPEGTDVYSGMGGNAALGRVSCKYSIKIPDFGMGTDTYNANGEEGQINLAAGSNTVCTFKVDSLDETTVKLTVNGLQKTFLLNESGYVDVLFACWMSADCHSNYLRIRFSETENSSTETGTQTENSDIVVPNESQAIASDRDTFATTPTPAETKKSTGGKVTVTTAYNHVGDGYYPYTGDDLWGSPVTIRAGVGDTVSWIVTVPSGTDVFGGMGGKASLGRVACNYSIKIPDFGMGTKDYNANGEAGQVNLAAGSNTVFTFKVDSMDSNGNVKLTVNGTQKSFKLNDNGYIDVLFACWMGADCHSNHIRIYITEHSDATNSPKTGESDSLWLWITWIFLFAGGIAAVKWYKFESKLSNIELMSAEADKWYKNET